MIELPEDNWITVFPRLIWICNRETNEYHHIKGSYTLLGKPDEIKEEDVKKLVHSDLNEMTDEFFCRDYKSDWVDNFDLLSALESFHSALGSEIYWNVNPIDIKGQTFSNEHENKWQQAQEKTFDKNRTLIFVKN